MQRFEPNQATDYMSMNVRALRVDVLFMWVLVCLDRSRASCLCVNARARVCVCVRVHVPLRSCVRLSVGDHRLMWMYIKNSI